MKAKFSLLFFAVFFCQLAGAQSRSKDTIETINAIAADERIITGKDTDVCLDYYSGKTTVSGETITYVIEKDTFLDKSINAHKVHNECNTLPNFPSIKFSKAQSREHPFVATNETVLESIIRSSVSASTLNTLSYYGGGIWIYMRSDPDTGQVLEVEFRIHTHTSQKKSPRMVSPVELEKIEKGIKNQIVYDFPDCCKDYDFIRTACNVYFMNGIHIIQ